MGREASHAANFTQDRASIGCSYTGSHLDWRWEYLEDTAEQVLAIYYGFQVHFKKEEWEGEGKIVEDVWQSLRSDFFLCFLCLIVMFTKAVGRECSRIEGCYCHEELLVTNLSYRQRNKALAAATGNVRGHCPWKGKWIGRFALGYFDKDVAPRVRAASSDRYTATLTRVPVPVSSRMKRIEFLLKDKWCTTVSEKQHYYQKIPHSATGGFGEFIGHTKQEAKACLMTGFL